MKRTYDIHILRFVSNFSKVFLFFATIFFILQIQICCIVFADWFDITTDVMPMYKRCVFASSKKILDQPPLLIRTIGAKCYEQCDTNCKAAFQIVDVDPKEDDGNQLNYLQALKSENADLLEECFKNCVSGTSFSATVIIPEQYPNIESYVAVNTKFCQQDSNDRIEELSSGWPYKIDMRISKENIIYLTDMPDSDYFSNQDQLIEDVDDSIYLCGYKTVQIFPKPYSVGNKKTGEDPDDGNIPPGTDPWQNVPTDPMKMQNDQWHARSASWFNTKIYPHDGDFLRVTYGGQFLNCFPPPPPTTHKCYDPISHKTSDSSCTNRNTCWIASEDPVCYDGYGTHGCWASPCPTLTDGCQYSPDSYDLQIHNPQFSTDWVDGFNSGSSSPSSFLKLQGSDLSMEVYFLNPKDYEKQGTDALISAVDTLQKQDAQKNADLYNKTSLNLHLTGGLDSHYQKYKRNIQFDQMRKPYNHDSYRIQTFSGYLQNYSSVMSTFGIRHNTDYSANEVPKYKNWLQNVGGYYVQIKWRGCRYQNGNQLEFTVVPEEKFDETDYLPRYFAQTKNWREVQVMTSKGGKPYATIDLSKAADLLPALPDGKEGHGFVYVRVKTLVTQPHPWTNLTDCSIVQKYFDRLNCRDIACSNSYARCMEEYNYSSNPATYARANTIGKYVFVATKASPDDKTEICGIAADIVKLFCQKLFGDKCNANDCKYCSSTGSIVSQTFKLIVSDNIFIASIRALLVLFIAWLGIAVALGMTKMQHKEGLLIIFKVAIVLTLISPGSWDFFYKYLFGAAVEGMQELMNVFFYRIPKAPYKEVCIKWLPILISFDDLLDEFSSSANWMRVLSMFFSSLTGMIMAIFLVVSFCIAFLAIIKVILMIIMALISIALMIILAPLFFSFLLFKQTSGMARKWFKQTLVFVLEPAVACGAVSMFIGILIILIKSMLNFTYCQVCFIRVDLILFTLCIGNKPIPLFTLHSPDEFYVPILMFSTILTVGALCHALYILPSLVSQTIGQVIEIGAVTMNNMGGVGGVVNAITKPTKAVLGATAAPYNGLMTLIGRDDKSREMRKDNAEKKADEMNKDVQKKQKGDVKKGLWRR